MVGVTLEKSELALQWASLFFCHRVGFVLNAASEELPADPDTVVSPELTLCSFCFFVEKLRRSLPNLTRSSAVAQGPEPVKNSRSCESNLQVPNGSPRHQNQSASEYIVKDVDTFLFQSILLKIHTKPLNSKLKSYSL